MPWRIIFPYIQKTSIFFYAINKNLFYYSIDAKRTSYNNEEEVEKGKKISSFVGISSL